VKQRQPQSALSAKLGVELGVALRRRATTALREKGKKSYKKILRSAKSV